MFAAEEGRLAQRPAPRTTFLVARATHCYNAPRWQTGDKFRRASAKRRRAKRPQQNLPSFTNKPAMPWLRSNWRAGRRKPGSMRKRHAGTRPQRSDSGARNGRARRKQRWPGCDLLRRQARSRDSRRRLQRELPDQTMLRLLRRVLQSQVSPNSSPALRLPARSNRRTKPEAARALKTNLRISHANPIWAKRPDRRLLERYKRKQRGDLGAEDAAAVAPGGAEARELPPKARWPHAGKLKTVASRRLSSARCRRRPNPKPKVKPPRLLRHLPSPGLDVAAQANLPSLRGWLILNRSFGGCWRARKQDSTRPNRPPQAQACFCSPIPTR